MKDYIVFHKTVFEKIGKLSVSIFAFFLIVPSIILIYLENYQMALGIYLFFLFILLLNILILSPSFIKIKYKLKITDDGISFYLFVPSRANDESRYPTYKKYYVQFSEIKNYVIKNQSLILYYQKKDNFYIEKRKINNLKSENLFEISNILLQKIGDKFNTGFKQPIFTWLWQNFHITLILAMITTIIVAVIFKIINNFF